MLLLLRFLNIFYVFLKIQKRDFASHVYMGSAQTRWGAYVQRSLMGLNWVELGPREG